MPHGSRGGSLAKKDDHSCQLFGIDFEAATRWGRAQRAAGARDKETDDAYLNHHGTPDGESGIPLL